jgi:hypothetical protein
MSIYKLFDCVQYQCQTRPAAASRQLAALGSVGVPIVGLTELGDIKNHNFSFFNGYPPFDLPAPPDAKPDDATSELVHNHQHPMRS